MATKYSQRLASPRLAASPRARPRLLSALRTRFLNQYLGFLGFVVFKKSSDCKKFLSLDENICNENFIQSAADEIASQADDTFGRNELNTTLARNENC